MADCAADDRNWLRTRWLALAAALSADDAAANTVWDALTLRYCEPHRAYHNLSHIEALLCLADEERAHIKRPEIVALAIWFHDVVHDPRSHDNEQRSAAWARDAMKAIRLDEDLIAPVEQCILATHRHEVPSPHTEDLPLFLDLDLAILGAPEHVYRRYSEGVRIEYGWVPEPEYRAGRAGVLRRFLARPALFFTPAMAARYESRARHNIALELRELGQEI